MIDADRKMTPERVFEKAFIKVFAKDTTKIKDYFTRKKKHNEAERASKNEKPLNTK